MVVKGNLASAEEKDTILSFINNDWKNLKAKGQKGFNGIVTILVGESNEWRRMANGATCMVYVKTSFVLNYETGNLYASHKETRV